MFVIALCDTPRQKPNGQRVFGWRELPSKLDRRVGLGAVWDDGEMCAANKEGVAWCILDLTSQQQQLSASMALEPKPMEPEAGTVAKHLREETGRGQSASDTPRDTASHAEGIEVMVEDGEEGLSRADGRAWHFEQTPAGPSQAAANRREDIEAWVEDGEPESGDESAQAGGSEDAAVHGVKVTRSSLSDLDPALEGVSGTEARHGLTQSSGAEGKTRVPLALQNVAPKV